MEVHFKFIQPFIVYIFDRANGKVWLALTVAERFFDLHIIDDSFYFAQRKPRITKSDHILGKSVPISFHFLLFLIRHEDRLQIEPMWGELQMC